MPLDPLDWPKWLKQDLSHETAEIQLSAKNDKKVIKPYSLHAIYLMGMGWKTDVELWAKPEWRKNSSWMMLQHIQFMRIVILNISRMNGPNTVSKIMIYIVLLNANFWGC